MEWQYDSVQLEDPIAGSLSSASNPTARTPLLGLSQCQPQSAGPKLTRLTWWEWIYLTVAVLNISTQFGLTVIETIITTSTSSVDNELQQYSTILITLLDLLFATIFLIHGICQELPFEVLIQTFVMCLIWFTELTQFFTSSNFKDGEIRKVSVISTLHFVNIVSGVLVAGKYWQKETNLFDIAAVQRKFVRMYRTWMFGFSLLSICYLLFLSCLVLNKYVQNYDPGGIIIATFAAVYVGAWFLCGYKAIRGESGTLILTFYFLSIPYMAGIIFIFIKQLQVLEIRKWGEMELQLHILTIFFHVCLLFTFVLIHHNFGNGLPELLESGIYRFSRRRTQEREHEEMHQQIFYPSQPSTTVENYQGMSTSN